MSAVMIAQKCWPKQDDLEHKFESYWGARGFARRQSRELDERWYSYNPDMGFVETFSNGRTIKQEEVHVPKQTSGGKTDGV